MSRAVPTKACPYCGKKLQAKSRHHFRCNLSRHLSRGTCLPYEAEKHTLALRATNAILQAFGLGPFLTQASPVYSFGSGEDDPKGAGPKPDGRAKDIAELERMMRLENKLG